MDKNKAIVLLFFCVTISYQNEFDKNLSRRSSKLASQSISWPLSSSKIQHNSLLGRDFKFGLSLQRETSNAFKRRNDFAEIDSVASEAVFKFAKVWLSIPKIYVSLILPKNLKTRTEDVIFLLRKMTNQVERNVYFIVCYNITMYKPGNGLQNPSIMWFPFETQDPYVDCETLKSPYDYKSVSKTHFLFYTRTKNATYFRHCDIQFDSNVATYYRYNKTKSSSIVQFEEIYDQTKDQPEPQKNLLATFDAGSGKISLDGLRYPMWKRRNNLRGKIFSAITEMSQPAIMNIIPSKRPNRPNDVVPSGYYADIMNYLMNSLNFSLETRLAEKRYSWRQSCYRGLDRFVRCFKMLLKNAIISSV